MTANTVHPDAGLDTIRAAFAAVAAGDLKAFAAAFHPDATWNHRNDDRLGGVKHGVEDIVAFVAESVRLTTGTLRAQPEGILQDGAGRVAVLTRVSGTRPDGRTFDDSQVFLMHLEDGLLRSVDQYIGDPAAVTAFWA